MSWKFKTLFNISSLRIKEIKKVTGKEDKKETGVTCRICGDLSIKNESFKYDISLEHLMIINIFLHTVTMEPFFMA